MATAKEKLFASRIAKRAITILDVPEDMREAVMALLSDADRARQQVIQEGGN